MIGGSPHGYGRRMAKTSQAYNELYKGAVKLAELPGKKTEALIIARTLEKDDSVVCLRYAGEIYATAGREKDAMRVGRKLSKIQGAGAQAEFEKLRKVLSQSF